MTIRSTISAVAVALLIAQSAVANPVATIVDPSGQYSLIPNPDGSIKTASTPYVATSKGRVSFNVSGTAVALSAPAGSTVCYLQTVTNAVNYWLDGTSPTAAVGGGIPLPVGSQLVVSIANLANAVFIAQTGTATIVGGCFS